MRKILVSILLLIVITGCASMTSLPEEYYEVENEFNNLKKQFIDADKDIVEIETQRFEIENTTTSLHTILDCLSKEELELQLSNGNVEEYIVLNETAAYFLSETNSIRTKDQEGCIEEKCNVVLSYGGNNLTRKISENKLISHFKTDNAEYILLITNTTIKQITNVKKTKTGDVCSLSGYTIYNKLYS